MLLSASAEFMTSWQCLNNACSDVSALSPPQKNWVIRFPPYFAQGILWMTSENAQIFMKIWRLVSEKFFETETIFSRPPFTDGLDAKILFLSMQRPQLHKKILSLSRTSHFGDMGSEFQLSYLFPKNWVGRSPPYFAQSILGMTSKTLKVSCKSRKQFLRYLAFYCLSLWPR